MFTKALLVATAFASPPAQKDPLAEISLSRNDLFPARIYLVEGRTLSPTSCRVLNVYIGPTQLKKKTFTGEFQFAANIGSNIPVPVTQGQIGLFWITEDKTGKLLFYREGRIPPKFYFIDSVRPCDKDYSRYLVLADVLATIYRASDQDRLRTIDNFVKAGESEKAMTALWQLVINVSGNPKVADYLQELSRDATLTIPVQLLIHNSIGVKGWLQSQAELDMVGRWFTGSWKEPKHPWTESADRWQGSWEDNLLQWLNACAICHCYSEPQQLLFAIKGLANPVRSAKFKEELLRRLHETRRYWTCNGTMEKSAGFQYLVKKIKEDANLAEKRAAAQLLAMFAPFSARQNQELRTLLGVVRDEDVIGELRMLLAKSVRKK